MYKELNIENFKTYVRLGNDREERLARQPVVINISLRFPDDNASCYSDNLNDTICYAFLLEFLNERLEKTNFKLIEKITQFIYELVREYLRNKNEDNKKLQIKVKLSKINPPIEDVGSTSFVISDW